MKRLRRKLPVIASCMWLLCGLPVYAADTGNAVQDILLSDRFNGAMSSIEFLTNIIDIWFIRVITITAFFIISSSIFKNVAAGAVCAFPKFWRRVHEAHERKALKGLFTQGAQFIKGLGKGGGAPGAAAGSAGGIGDVIFAIIPDFMALTEFADTDISPKQYFLKAIPEMIAAVCIGIFIYNGLYRDTLATIGTAGSNIITNVLAASNPDQLTHFIFNNIKEPSNSFKNDPTIKGRWIYAISQQLYRTLNANSTVFAKTEEGKQGLMGFCEQWAQQLVNSTEYKDNVFVANDAIYYDMSTPTVQLLTVKPDDVIPTPDSDVIYFSKSASVEDIVADPNVQSDPGFYHDGMVKYIQVSCNFSVKARSGQTIETQIKAVEGTLASGSGSLPNMQVTVNASGWITSNSGADGSVVDFAGFGPEIKNAIFGAAIAGGDASQYGINDDSKFFANGYGYIGVANCNPLPISSGSSGVNVDISYNYTPIDAAGKPGKTVTKNCTVYVTFTTNGGSTTSTTTTPPVTQ